MQKAVNDIIDIFTTVRICKICYWLFSSKTLWVSSKILFILFFAKSKNAKCFCRPRFVLPVSAFGNCFTLISYIPFQTGELTRLPSSRNGRVSGGYQWCCAPTTWDLMGKACVLRHRLFTWAGLARLVGLTRVTNIFSRPQKKIWIKLRMPLHLN